MQDFRTTAHVTTIGPRPARPVVPIRYQADELLLEHATAYTRLVQTVIATAPNGDFGDLAASHTITDPDTGNTVGGGSLPDFVVRTLTAVFNDAADRLAGDGELTAVMDAVFAPAPLHLVAAGGAR